MLPTMESWKDRTIARATAMFHWWMGILHLEEDRWRAEAGIGPIAEPAPAVAAPAACSKADEPVPLAMLVAQRQAEVDGRDDSSRN